MGRNSRRRKRAALREQHDRRHTGAQPHVSRPRGSTSPHPPDETHPTADDDLADDLPDDLADDLPVRDGWPTAGPIIDWMMREVIGGALGRGWAAHEMVDLVRWKVSAWASLMTVGYFGAPDPSVLRQHDVFDRWRQATFADHDHAISQALEAVEAIARLPAVPAIRRLAS